MEKKKKQKKSHNKIRIVSIIILIILVIWYFNVCPNFKNEKVFLNIDSGQSISSISKELKENNLIRNELFFKLTLKQMKADSKIQSGTHVFSTSMDMYSVIKELTKPTHKEKINFTIPEGYTIAQIQEKLDKQGLMEDFSKNALNLSIREQDFLYSTSTEGYLFPDTYEISKDMKSRELIDAMLKNFEEKIQNQYFNDILASGVTYFKTDDFNEALYKTLTVASLIEREAKVPEERKLIASVIYNRLEKGMPLQIDATVSYDPGKSKKNKSKTTYKDLKKKSPYNTYVIKGLPKGPICNPGVASFEAACKPAKTDYLFYVTSGGGAHKFTKTFEEHKKAKK